MIIDETSVASGQVPVGDEQIVTDSGFFWREQGDVKVLVCRRLEEAGFVNGFSTRAGGVSPFPDGDLNLAGYDEDAAENIEENRRRFLAVIDGVWQLTTVWQDHGYTAKVVDDPKAIARTNDHADALISRLNNV
ncbi:MAG: laccase domain-containing protein, partial [Pyrinomonadaceae bacterium]